MCACGWVWLTALLGALSAGVWAGEPPTVANGSMTDGADAPTGWEQTYVTAGKLKVVRDTADFAKGPASLCLMSVDGPADGNCSQPIANAAGRTFTVKGYAKAAGERLEYASVAVMVQGPDWQVAKWQDLRPIMQDRDWTPFEQSVTVPDDAANVLLILLLRGEGKVWMDEVEVVGAAPPAELIDLSAFSGPQPKVVHVAAVAPDVLSLTVQARQLIPGRFVPYEMQPGDQLQPRQGRGSARELMRDGRRVGLVVGQKAEWLCIDEGVTGAPLQAAYADDPANYLIVSTDDTAYAQGARPQAVYRKSAANNEAPDRYFPQEHHIYLRLSSPLSLGKSYEIRVSKLNVDPAAIAYRHDPARVRSEAVHATQAGFRPDDPAKVAFLSLWMGTGGGYAGYGERMEFSLIAERSGERVFTGKARLAQAAGQPSPGGQTKGRNYNEADVYELDFSAFRTPGTYRVCVEGIGCSCPFAIADDAWQKAFRIAARGFYHQRSGIALTEPYTDWTRPRGFHPDDGKVVYETTFRRNESRGQGDTFQQLAAHRTENVVPNAWGGYFDAGDWDRHVGHLSATRSLLELLELFPDYLRGLDLNIPESGNDVPDLMDEALWNIDCYRRMQTADGGIRGGIESEEHPAEGETSWTDTLLLMAFAPDYDSSWIYAGVAARAAHWFETNGAADRSRPYRESALRAMEWAEKDFLARHPDGQGRWQETDDRNLAALELYRLTRDPKWHDLFRQTCGFANGSVLQEWGHHAQRDAAFVYARLDDALADAQVKRNAREGLIKDAEDELEFGRQAGFHWVLPDFWTPVGWGRLGAPQAERLVRGHALTGELKYLAGIVLASQYSAGANPLNMPTVSGVGSSPVKNILYVDARRTGRTAPPGITVYGPLDMAVAAPPDWVTRWKLIPGVNVTPPIREWPLTEAYWDIYSWPEVCEFTVVQTMGPTAYVWGYLAARP